MKIDYIKINGFGKLEDKEIELKNHINIIYGKNEAGKTTLLKFISGMFYGVSKNKNRKEISDFERYKPWNKENFSGKIKYTLDNKKEYEVFRDFSKKNPQIYNQNGEEISKEFNIDKTKGNEFFYEQTQIDEETFLSTTMITQKQVILDDNEQQILTQKMTNILSTGEENISYKKAMEKLNKKVLEEIGTERTTGKPINLIEAKIKEINIEKNDIDIAILQKEQVEKNIEEAEKEIIEKNKKIDMIKEIKKYKEKNLLEEEKIKINKNIIDEENEKIHKLNDKIEKNTIINKKNNYLFLIVALVLTILNIIVTKAIFKISLIFLIIINLIIFLRQYIKNRHQIKLQNENKNKNLSEIEIIKSNIENTKNKIEKIEKNIQLKNIEQKDLIQNKYSKEIENNETNYLINENIDILEYKIEELEAAVSALKLKINSNKIEYNNLIEKMERKIELEEKLERYSEEKVELMKLNSSINLAKTALERAYNKMKNEITPKFTKKLSCIVEKISSGKYKNIKFIEGNGIIVEQDNGEYLSANRLSIGTIDQLYLSLRLSAIEELTNEKMPIILDESFAFYDDERLVNILKYLNENYNENQIIIFTCSNREKEILEKNNINFSFISM